ncbi:hypothetical protein MKEN_00835800 [Mycena kentingensis (nom. inval.)]|nr:hypothetical protein MKEN_00835800 [Mycena kentingensis (nom. inval.)]
MQALQQPQPSVPCPFCRKKFTKGTQLSTHKSTCPQRKSALATAQKAARAAQERRVAQEVESTRLASENARLFEEQQAAQRAEDERAQELIDNPPPPELYQSGRVARTNRRLPTRYRQEPPAPPPPAPLPPPPPSLPPPPAPAFAWNAPDAGDAAPAPPATEQRCWVKTSPNGRGQYKIYPRQPTHDPDRIKTLEDLCRNAGALRRGALRRGKALYLTPRLDSAQGADTMVHGLICNPNVKPEELKDFSFAREVARLDKYATDPPGEPPNGWKRATIELEAPCTKAGNKPLLKVKVEGVPYRPLLDVIKEAFQGPLFERLHTTPFSYRRDRAYDASAPDVYDSIDALDDVGLPRLPDNHIDVFGEVYTSHRTLKQYSKLPKCTEEPVIVSLIPYSDSTHLAQFGDASLWAMYMFFGNQSKDERGRPTANAGFDQAYFPSLPESLAEDYLQYYGHPISDDVLKFLKRELIHRLWDILLTPEFIDAWINGFPLECWDKLIRRLFPRFAIYGADYPEKILLATIKFLAKYPCPRCLILKAQIPETGTVHDLARRAKIRVDQETWRGDVDRARVRIFEHNNAVEGDVVEGILGVHSWVPVKNAFTKITEAGGDFNLFEMFVPDLLHEIELGVAKSLFTHLVRILFALDSPLVVQLDARGTFREIDPFGRMTIRRFHRNTSEMKRMAARDFEDIIQCLLPVCEGLFGDLDELVQTLAYRLARWHAFAKLRLHTTDTVARFRIATSELTTTIRKFQRHTKSVTTYELPREQTARARKAVAQAKKKASTGQGPATGEPVAVVTRLEKGLNLETYKYHSLADYPDMIVEVGTSDSTSTQSGEQRHKKVKAAYARTNKRNYEAQIATIERRVRILQRMQHRKKLARLADQRASGQNNTDADLAPLDSMPTTTSNNKGRNKRLLRALHPSEYLQPFVPAEQHHYISNSKRTFWKLGDLPSLDTADNDPALKRFVRNLREHIRRRLEGTEDEDIEYTVLELLEVAIALDKIYTHATMRVNYTTYDNMLDQDCVSPRTRPYIMVRSRGRGTTRIRSGMGVFAAYSMPTSVCAAPYPTIEWNSCGSGGCGATRLTTASRTSPVFPASSTSPIPSPTAFGFIDPDTVIRGIHMVPAFAFQRTNALLPPSIVRAPKENNTDWRFYYANGFADRDLFMRYEGDGIGHTDGWEPAVLKATTVDDARAEGVLGEADGGDMPQEAMDEDVPEDDGVVLDEEGVDDEDEDDGSDEEGAPEEIEEGEQDDDQPLLVGDDSELNELGFDRA